MLVKKYSPDFTSVVHLVNKASPDSFAAYESTTDTAKAPMVRGKYAFLHFGTNTSSTRARAESGIRTDAACTVRG